MTFSEIKTNLDAIAETIVAEKGRVDSAKAQLEVASFALGELAATYGLTLTAITDLLAASPDDAAAQGAAAEKALLIADFQALKASVDTAIAAL